MGEDLEEGKIFINGIEFKGVTDIEFEKIVEDHPEPKIYNNGYSISGELIINKRFKKQLLRKLKWWRFKYKIKSILKRWL